MRKEWRSDSGKLQSARGMSIFKSLDKTLDLNLQKAIAFDCGIVLLYYEPK